MYEVTKNKVKCNKLWNSTVKGNLLGKLEVIYVAEMGQATQNATKHPGCKTFGVKMFFKMTLLCDAHALGLPVEPWGLRFKVFMCFEWHKSIKTYL